MQFRRVGISLFLCAFIGLALIESMPSSSLLHKRLKTATDPIVDKTGIWQSTWNLFAPEVDKENVRVSAEIEFEGGKVLTWRSPDWRTYSGFQKFIHFRKMEYYDSVRLNSNRGAWEGLADYLAAHHTWPVDPGLPVVEVRLTRHWAKIPAPRRETPLIKTQDLVFQKKYMFFDKRY